MQTEISSQKQFDSIESKFRYDEYRKFSKAYVFNKNSRIIRTGLNINVAFPRQSGERKRIMAGMGTSMRVDLMNGKARALAKNFEKDADTLWH